MENLKILRKKNKKKQDEVASHLQIARSTYQTYEYGIAEPNFETLKKLADYFHTTVDYLIDHEVPYLINKSEFSAKQLSLIEEVKSLNSEQCDRILSYIHGMKSDNR